MQIPAVALSGKASRYKSQPLRCQEKHRDAKSRFSVGDEAKPAEYRPRPAPDPPASQLKHLVGTLVLGMREGVIEQFEERDAFLSGRGKLVVDGTTEPIRAVGVNDYCDLLAAVKNCR